MEPDKSPTPAAENNALAVAGTVAIVGMIALVIGTAVWFTARTDAPAPPPRTGSAEAPIPPGDSKLRAQVVEAYRKAADRLVAQQTPEGAWPSMLGPSPSSTALVISALAAAPADIRKSYQGAIDKGLGFLVKSQGDDGAFSESNGLYKTYATGVVLSALGTDRVKYKDAIARAHGWARKVQVPLGSALAGGFGYGDQGINSKTGEVEPKKANLSTSNLLVQGLDDSGFPQDDPLRDLVVRFAKANQNSSETNIDPEVLKALREGGYEVGNDGGFVYDVLTSKAPPDPADPKVLRSYGSMTYAGLKIYLFGGLKRDDPAVRAAIDYIRRTFTVERHPGYEFDTAERSDQRGIYYYYLTMARCLDAWGENPLKLEGGKSVDWPSALARKLLALQKEAAWFNENDKWMEGEPIVVTGYVLNICNVLLKHIR